MEEELKLATAALEAGDRKRAQRLLALFLKRDPENVHGWLALSQTVEDQKKKRAFLSKVLSIDPLNETARARLAALDEPEIAPAPMPVEKAADEAPAEPAPEPEPPEKAVDETPAEPAPPADVAVAPPEAEGPPWEDELEEEPAPPEDAPVETAEPVSAEEPAGGAMVPNEEAKTQVFVQEKSTTAVTPKPAYPPAEPAPDPSTTDESSGPDYLLLLLLLLAIVVGFYLVYLLWQILA